MTEQTTSEKVFDIHDAILAVMLEVDRVEKEYSAKLGYSFAGEAALIQAVRPSMIRYGIHVHVSEISQRERERYATKSGTMMVSTLLTGNVTFTHAPSETNIVVFAIGEGADSGDKSANKAMTAMLKYALRQTFLLPSLDESEDPDATPSTHQERAMPETDEQKKAVIFEQYAKLMLKASTLEMSLPVMGMDMSLEDMTTLYKEQRKAIKNKENS